MGRGSNIVFNLPNSISWLRIVLTGLVVWLLYSGQQGVAFVLFVIATVSDYVDGALARRTGQITNLGKVLDQMSDKILLTSVMVVFVERHVLPGWYVVVLVFRDTLVSMVRMLTSKAGKVVAANLLGKAKTVSQMLLTYGVFLQLFGLLEHFLSFFNVTMLWLSTVLTIVSGVVYLYENREILNS